MIVDGHGFESVLRGAMEFELKPCLDYRPDGEDRPKLMLVVHKIFRPRRGADPESEVRKRLAA